jgi:hypothetical protein
MLNKNEIQKVLNKLPEDKVELEKVQLSLIDDMKSAISELKKEFDGLQKAEREQFEAVVAIRQAIKNAQKVDKKSVDLSKKAVARGDKYAKLIGQARKAAEDLGIKQGDIKEVKQLFAAIDDLDMKADDIVGFNFSYDKVK